MVQTIIYIVLLFSLVFGKEIDYVLFREIVAYKRNQLNTLSDTSIIKIVKALEIPSTEEGKFIKESLEDAVSNSIQSPQFFCIDVSGDSLKDIIYESNYGAEEKHIIIWINSGSAYYYSGSLYGYLLKIAKYQDSESYYIITVSGFCCASWVGYITRFVPETKNNRIRYVVGDNYEYFYNLRMPDTLISPIQFQTINDKYKLRYSPEINNELDTTLFKAEDNVSGNVLAEFTAGSIGKAIAQSKNDGRVWWFVIMDKKNESTDMILYHKDVYKLGWMSSKYLKIIE